MNKQIITSKMKTTKKIKEKEKYNLFKDHYKKSYAFSEENITNIVTEYNLISQIEKLFIQLFSDAFTK